jgi:hypothetical protein
MRRVANQPDLNAAVLTIRVPVELREQIDAALAKRPIKIPRNTWVLEAVLEKLARDQQKGGDHGSR